MMTKTKTSRFSGIKFLWALPAVALLLFAFAEPVYKVYIPETENPASIQQKTEKEFVIKGKVIQDETGKPLQGASVIIKGTSSGTISDEDGNFTLIDPNPKKGENGGYFTDLVISFVGRETKLITVSSVDDKLEMTVPDIKMKEGVVVLHPDYFIAPPPPPPIGSEDNNLQAPPPPPPTLPANKQEEVFIVVEEFPEYPDGLYALGEYITEMQRKLAQSNNLSGKSKIGFTVSETGKVTDVKIVEKDNDEVGEAAATIVMNMKTWKPGKQRGKPVPVKYLLPLEFN